MINLSLRDVFHVALSSIAYDLEQSVEMLTGCRAQLIVPQKDGPPVVFATTLGGTSCNVLIDLSKDGSPAVQAFDGRYLHGFCALAGGVLGLNDTGQVAFHAFGAAPCELTVTGRDHETRRLTPAL